MEEIIMENIVPSKEKFTKTWNFVEKQNRHVTHHTFSICGKRFTHQAEIKEASQAMKQRTDFNLDNVKTVNSYYGLSRNIALVVILAVIAAFALIFALVGIGTGGEEAAPVSIVFIIIAALLGVVAFLVYKKIKPAFILEIETVIPKGQIVSNRFAYGSATINFGKKKLNPIFYLFLIVCFPIGIIYLLTHNKSNKYIFEMDEATGMEIVDTIGEYLIKD